MSEDDHTNGAMETNENSDSNENSVRNKINFHFSCVSCKAKKKTFPYTFYVHVRVVYRA